MEIDVHELAVSREEDACARSREWLAGWSSDLPPQVAGEVELLTHELISNAFRHSHSERAWVTALTLPGSVLVQVTDEGCGDPVIRPFVPYSESGRGLRWVSAMARSWGVLKHNTTGVWFQVDLPAKDGARLAGLTTL